ncbi:MAG: protein kinase [Cytophagales bacterium]|nr:protein kinase [Cytophagales bacterium]
MKGKKVLNYQIEELIGQGGMGQVFLASNTYIDQKVAIKVLASRLANHQEVKRRFEQEANLLASLDHQNIVKFLNYVENEEGVFLIMEYVRGETLDEYIRKISGPIPEERTLEMFGQLLDAFTYAHAQGIVHRDIKPSNILITEDLKVKVLDFGIARIIKESVPGETKVGTKMGTALYMSPEQVQGQSVDIRSDIYALGVVLHQMISGQAPYDDTTMSEYEINHKIVEEQLPRAKEFYPYASDNVQIIIDQAVEKLPEDRFESCEAFKEHLTQAIAPVEEKSSSSKALKWVVAAILFLLFGAGGWYWDYSRVKVRIYRDYVERWGVAEGIHRLNKDEFQRAETAIKFEYQGYKLRRISRVNHIGLIKEYRNSEDVERPYHARYFYQSDGKIDFVEVLDDNGKVLYIKDYNQKLNVVTFRQADEFGTELSLAGQSSEMFTDPFLEKEDKGEITRWLLDYDENGFVSRVLYAKIQNELTSDQNGIFGRKIGVDEKGRIRSINYLDREGNLKETQLGFAGKTYEYDLEDNRIRASWIDKEGGLTRNSQGHSYEVVYYDEYGNPIREEYYDDEDNPMITEVGIFGWESAYDENGNELYHFYLDTEGKRAASNNGVAGQRYEYDEFGNTTSTVYYDAQGQITYSTSGIAIITSEYDDKGNISESWFRNPQNELTYSGSGYAGFKIQRDSLGNTIDFRVFDTEKKPSLQRDGTHGYLAKYDERSNVVEFTRIGVDGKPVVGSGNVAITRTRYDQKGNTTQIGYYGESNEPTLSKEGISGIKYEYDNLGHEVSREFLGLDSTLTSGEIGYARVISEYDAKGNKTSVLYHDEDNLPVMQSEGYAGWKAKYDDQGNQTEFARINKDGAYADGYLITKYKYKGGQVVELKYYDQDLKPALNKKQYAGWYANYDEKGQILQKTYIDKDSEATITDDGYSSVSYVYDRNGNITRVSFFNDDLKPTDKNNYGVPVVKMDYDKSGRLISQRYFEANGETKSQNTDGVFESSKAYDPIGRLISESNLRKDGRLAKIEGVAAEKRYEYDAHGNRIKTYYVNQTDQLINAELGYAIARSKFNYRGKVIEESYYNALDQKIRSKEGYHKYLNSFDEKGNLTLISYQNVGGNLVNNSEGYATVNYDYDKSGRNIEISYRDRNNRLSNLKSKGYARSVTAYNGDKLSSKKWYDKSKRLVKSESYDREGELLYVAYSPSPGKTMRTYVSGKIEFDILDGFTSNRNGWNNLNTSYAKIKNGKCTLVGTDEFRAITSDDFFIKTKNFVIETKLKITEKSNDGHIGVAWLMGNKWSRFFIGEKQFYTEESKWKTTSVLRSRNYNLLKVVVQDGKLSYYINGTRVLSDHNNNLEINKSLAMTAYSSTAEIDYVRVSTVME